MRLAFAVLLVAASAFTARTVNVSGQALISGGDKAAARDAAIKQAQKVAIEQVVGAYVESQFTAEQKETMKDGKSSFSSHVEDLIRTKSEGFVERQRILHEGEQDGLYKVSMQIDVRAAPLAEELKKLSGLLAAQGYPKIMVLVQEQYTDRGGATKTLAKSTVRAIVEDAFLGYGIELVTRDKAPKLSKAEALFAELAKDPKPVASAAAEAGAEIIVAADAPVKCTGFNELNDNMYYAAATVSLRAIRTSTGQVLASHEATGKGIGVNEELAREKALRAAAPQLVERLFQSMVQAWQQEQDRGTRVVLIVDKVGNYAKVARPLMKAIEQLPGVASVKETAFANKRLELEVLYKGTKKALLEAIFDQVATQKAFSRLDKTGDDGSGVKMSL